MAMFTPAGHARELAAVTMRLAAEAIADGDTALAAAVLDQARAGPASSLLISSGEFLGEVSGRGGYGRAPSSNITGTSRSRATASRTACRSAASSPSAELTNTRTR